MGKRRKKERKKNIPPLVRLRYRLNGREVWCELCGEPIQVGDAVAWWEVPRFTGATRSIRRTAYCATCHSVNVRAGHAIPGTGKRIPARIESDEAELDGGFRSALEREGNATAGRE